MNHKYTKKSNINKSIEFHKIIDSIIIEDVDYREIFDNAVQFEYGDLLLEYTENHVEKIMVNNIRHNFSNYDQITKCMHKIKRNNSESDYIQYKNSVLDKIGNKYSFLRNECDKQKRKFDMVKII